MAAVFPSSQNVFVPNHEASGKLVVDFARNTKDFAVNKYVQVVPVEQVKGYYLKVTVEEAGRIINSDLSQFVWADGAAAPEGMDGLESFEFFGYETIRRAFPFTMGALTIKQASWDIVAQHASIKARQAMTARTQLAITALTTSGNYDSSHVLDVTTISGNSGPWNQSTTARQDIKRSLNTAAEVILDDTLGAIQLSDLNVVLSSALAKELSECQEIVDYIKGTPDALAQIRGELPSRNAFYGIPDTLYGFPILVEATRKVTNKKGATRAVSSVLGKSTPFMCARPGALQGVADAPNFSTCVIFAQEEMTVEQFEDTNNRRTTGRVVENVVAKIVAPASGVLFNNASG